MTEKYSTSSRNATGDVAKMLIEYVKKHKNGAIVV
jgi:hypothetical protein